MIQDIEKFKGQCAKWKVTLERVMIVLPISLVVGFIFGFLGARKKFIVSSLFEGIDNFERFEFTASILAPVILIYVYLFFIRQILGQFSKGQFFEQSVFKNIEKVGQISFIFGALLMPIILLIVMVVFAGDFTLFDLLITYVKGMNYVSIVLGILLLLVGRALLMAQVYYEDQKLTI